MTTYVVAGFVAGPRWVPPGEYAPKGNGLPGEVATVSECLVDFAPPGRDWWLEPWFETAGEARAHSPRPLSMSVPLDQAGALEELVVGWLGDLPSPLPVNLRRRAGPPGGRVLGFEVLGFEHGRFHTWLCYSYLERAAGLGIHPNEHGLIGGLADATRLTGTINTDGSTPEEVTWFPAMIGEH